jgi:hypothetical protein
MALVLVALFQGMIAEDPRHDIKVGVSQNDRMVPPKDHTVRLARQEFAFVFDLDGPTEFLVSASFNQATYDAARAGRPLAEIPGLTGSPIEEESFNIYRSMIVDDTAPLRWYYADEIDYRFDGIDEENLICTRTVSSVRTQDDLERFIPIEELTRPELYLVFIRVDRPAEGKMTEKAREFLRIVFE